MLTTIDIQIAESRKKLWDKMGWVYKGNGVSFFKHNHSLNCGCRICKLDTFFKRFENRIDRHHTRIYLNQMSKNIF